MFLVDNTSAAALAFLSGTKIGVHGNAHPPRPPACGNLLLAFCLMFGNEVAYGGKSRFSLLGLLLCFIVLAHRENNNAFFTHTAYPFTPASGTRQIDGTAHANAAAAIGQLPTFRQRPDKRTRHILFFDIAAILHLKQVLPIAGIPYSTEGLSYKENDSRHEQHGGHISHLTKRRSRDRAVLDACVVSAEIVYKKVDTISEETGQQQQRNGRHFALQKQHAAGENGDR